MDTKNVGVIGLGLMGTALTERLLGAVRSSEALARHGVTVSGGVAQWAPGELPDDLLRRADEALYAAKRHGRDRVERHDGTALSVPAPPSA